MPDEAPVTRTFFPFRSSLILQIQGSVSAECEQNLVYRLAYNGDVAAGSAAADISRRERSARIWIHTGRSAAAEEKQPTDRGRRVALKMDRRLSGGRRIGYVSS
jgi:hypothetical protein